MRGAKLARPARALEGGELIPQNERKLRRSDGSGMLIDDPLGEGSKVSSTDSKLWRAENSFLRMRGNSDAHKGAACSKVTLCVRGAVLALPMRSSGAEKPFLWGTPRRERHALKWPSVVRGAMLARPTRRADYHRALGSGETQTLRVRGNSDAQKGAVCS